MEKCRVEFDRVTWEMLRSCGKDIYIVVKGSEFLDDFYFIPTYVSVNGYGLWYLSGPLDDFFYRGMQVRARVKDNGDVDIIYGLGDIPDDPLIYPTQGKAYLEWERSVWKESVE